MAKTRYIGLLRGINVGGHKKVPMADLRALFAQLGFDEVKTALASGNIAWDAEPDDIAALRARIEAAIEDHFGFSVATLVFPRQQVIDLVQRQPFAGIDVTPDTRLYVTFLPEARPGKLDIPYHAPDGDFSILSVSETEVCSVLTVSTTRSVDAMAILEREFGKDITTRNWNTVLKIAAL